MRWDDDEYDDDDDDECKDRAERREGREISRSDRDRCFSLPKDANERHMWAAPHLQERRDEMGSRKT